MTGTYGPNFLFGPAIGGAIGQGIQQGQQANALALATQAARSGDYGTLGNALLQLGDVRGAMQALETPYERQRQKTLDEQARQQAELQRRNIESEIKTREAAASARDIRQFGDSLYDFTDPTKPKLLLNKPDPFAEALGGGGGQPTGAPSPAMPAPAPSMIAAGPAPPAPEANQFGPRTLAATDLATGKGNLQAGLTGGLPQVGARPPPPIAKTLADLTPQQRRTALDLIRTGNRTGAEKYVSDILTGGGSSEEKPPSGYRWNAAHTALEPIPGGPATAIAPELSARVALGESFQADLPSIKGVLQQSFGSGGDPVAVNARSNMALGIGPEGDAYRKTQSGVDALIRMLTGAGLSSQETQDYAFRYMPNPYRDPFDTMTSKVDRLGRELNTITSIVTRGKGGADLAKELRDHIRQSQPESGGTSQQAQGAAPPPPKIGDVVRGWRYNGGDPAIESNWTQVQK